MSSPMLRFPDGFLWGTATATVQVDGAAKEGGKGESIWDRFAADPTHIADGTTPAVTCDHYHRYRDDLALMASLGLKNYRFSLAWPRIVPDGDGAVNQAGLDFYDRLIDAMLEKGIRPLATLFHWDLPQKLQEQGGFARRTVVEAYLRYVEIVVRRLGDRVKDWITHNEPWVFAFCGHLYGVHAPGLQDLRTALAVAHHVMLSHGKAVPAIRAACTGARVGLVQNLEWIEPASERIEDQAAATRWDGAFNRWFLDPMFGRGYPPDLVAWYGPDLPAMEPGDLESMAALIDFLGVNYYTRRIIAHDPTPRARSTRAFLSARQIYWPFVSRPEFDEWEIAPEGLYRTLLRVHRTWRPPRIYITENGTSFPDRPGPDGAVHDLYRIRYVARHAAAVHQAIADGAPVGGYILWSFMDNYEWGFGFTKRFGIIHVDYPTQKRTLRDSAHWYARTVRENGFPISDANANL